MRWIFIFLFSLWAISAFSQNKEKLFGPSEAQQKKEGFIISLMGDFDLPAADMAKRFGDSYRIGPALTYKTKNNWLIGIKGDFVYGDVVKQDSLFINIRDQYSTYNTHVYEFINSSGERIGVLVHEEGYIAGPTLGKIFPFGKHHPNDGLTLTASGGYIAHKISIFDNHSTVPQLAGDYKKGYDRLTTGGYAEGYAGYSHFSRNKLINYTIGFDGVFGFDRGRRPYLFDIMRPDTAKRLDILFGLRGGWYIPIFRRKSEEMLFE